MPLNSFPIVTVSHVAFCRVRYGRVNQDPLTDILITDPDVHHQEIAGLEKGIEYEFRVAGVNSVGPGQENIEILETSLYSSPLKDFSSCYKNSRSKPAKKRYRSLQN
jgi:hypothetical protein